MAQDRLDRIEAAIEAMQQRMNQEFDHQLQLNADFRTRQEIQSQSIEGLTQTVEELRQTVETLVGSVALLSARNETQSQNIQLPSQNIAGLVRVVQTLVEESRQIEVTDMERNFSRFIPNS